jgi:hypothetical protein
VYGGGGITPDLIVQPADSLDATLAFWQTLGPEIPHFRDVLAEYAGSLRASKRITSPDFVVTPAMRAELWRRLQRAGVSIDRDAFLKADSAVSRIMGEQIARTVIGPDAAFRRALHHDRTIAAALRLASGASSEHDLFVRATQLRDAQRTDAARTP